MSKLGQATRRGHGGRRLPHGLAVALLVAGIVIGSPTRAETLSPAQVVVMLQADDGIGRGLLAKVFTPLQGNPEAIADAAVAMIGRLEGDPIAMIGIATLIGEQAGFSLHAEFTLGIVVDPDYTVPEGGIGVDFGPTDGPVMRTFDAIDDRDARVYGAFLGARNGAGGGALLTDWLVGVDRAAVEVPNGDFELLLMTGHGGALGSKVVVNGREHRLIDPSTSGRIGMGMLTADLATPEPSAGEARGGMISIPVTIGNQRLELILTSETGAPTALAALLLVPVAAGPQVVFDAATTKSVADMAVRVAKAEERIAAAIAGLLAGVATAAGFDDRVTVLGLAEQPVPLENAQSVSPE